MQPIDNRADTGRSDGSDQTNDADQVNQHNPMGPLDFRQGDLLAQVVQALAIPTLDSPMRPSMNLQPRTSHSQAVNHTTHVNQTNNIFMTPVSGISFVQNAGDRFAPVASVARQQSPASPPRTPPGNATYAHYRNMARAVFGAAFDVNLDHSDSLFSEQLIPTPPPEAEQAGFTTLGEFERASWSVPPAAGLSSQQNQAAGSHSKKRKIPEGPTSTMTGIQGGRAITGMGLTPSLPSGMISRSGHLSRPTQAQLGPIEHHRAGVPQNEAAISSQALRAAPADGQAVQALPLRPRFPNQLAANQPQPQFRLLGSPPKLPRLDDSANLDKKPPGRPKEG